MAAQSDYDTKSRQHYKKFRRPSKAYFLGNFFDNSGTPGSQLHQPLAGNPIKVLIL